MKRIESIFLKALCCASICALLFTSCKKDDDLYNTYNVSVQLVYPNGYDATGEVTVKMTNIVSQTIFESKTDASGKAEFVVTAGTYEAMASEKRAADYSALLFNGNKTNIVVTNNWNSTQPVEVALSESKSNQIIIKEVYNGGCQKDGGAGHYQYDKYVILYNNSDMPATLENLCLAITIPFNSTSANSDMIDGALFYDAQKWVPAGSGFWTFSGSAPTLDPGKQIVIALNGAINHTSTFTNSVDLSKAEYYCTYDPQAAFTSSMNTSYYPTPSENIPTSNYMKLYFYGTGNAWSFSVSSPAFFLFTTKGSTPQAFANDPTNMNYPAGQDGKAVYARRKVPADWVIDGVEVFEKGAASNIKRLTSWIDAGYVELTNKQGNTLYRNVDKQATEAIAGNAAKLIYGYDNDPSGIDAELSVKAGAFIIFKDTNNSTNDFHQRNLASIK